MIWYAKAMTKSQTGGKNMHKEVPNTTARYRSYIVRSWQEHSIHAGQEILTWRFSLEDPRTNQRLGFANLEALLVALQENLTDARVD
jgi:hypothetical protein